MESAISLGFMPPDLLLLLDTILLDSHGRVRPLQADVIREIGHDSLRAWCHCRARYNIPSQELIHWLLARIDPHTTLEIGAGMGDLGRLLGGVKMTDSYRQSDHAETRAVYASIKAPPTEPPPDVEKLDAVEAVRKYRPKTVIAAWVTQCPRPGENPEIVSSTPAGVDEEQIWKHPFVETYIHIGNDNIHGDKRLLKKRHEKLYLPFLFSRQADPVKNVVYWWSKKWPKVK